MTGSLDGFKDDFYGEKHMLRSDGIESLWFLAYTRPRLETVALQNLQRQGFDAYLPFYKRLNQSSAGVQAIFEPMFPRHVFFKTSLQAQSIAPVRSTRGVAQVVSFGHGIATLGSHTLEAIRQMEQERNAVDAADLNALRPGHSVRFCNSALSGLKGLVKSVSSRRVTVLLELIGSQPVISVDHQQLEAI